MEAAVIVEGKLLELMQKGSATDYTTMFQTYITQTKWNQKAFMARYKHGLKWKVQNMLIYMPDTTII